MRFAQCHSIAAYQRLGQWLWAMFGIHIPRSCGRVVSPLVIAVSLAASTSSLAQSGRLDLVLLIDNAIAVTTEDAAQRLRETLAKLIPANDDATRIAIISYDDLAFPIIPLTRVTPASGKAMAEALSKLDFNAPNSNIAAGLERAIYEFDRNGHENAGRRILMIHGGEIRTGDFEQNQSFRRWTAEVLVPKAVQMSIQVQNFTFGVQTDVELAQKIADVTGGDHTRVTSLEDLIAQLNQIGSAIFASVTPAQPLSQLESSDIGRNLTAWSTPGSNQISDSPEFMATNAIASIDRLNQVAPTQAGADLTSDPTSRSSKRADQASNGPSVDQPAKSQRSALLWIVVGALTIGLIVALIAFAVMRRRNQRLSASQAALRSDKSGVRLVDLSGVSGRSTYTITDKLVRVCRTPGRDSYNVVCITIPDDVISREHAFIEYRDRDYFVTDRDSDNGTYVNGRRVQGPRKLEDGDRIRFATFEFAFECPVNDLLRSPPGTSADEATAITIENRPEDTSTPSGGLTLVHGSKGQIDNANDELTETGLDPDRTRVANRTLVH